MPKHFEILKNKKPDLPEVKMTCDNIIDKKLLHFHAIEACFSKSNMTLVSGGMGSGKSTLMIQMLKSILNECFEHIYFFIPEQSYLSIPLDDREYLQKHLVNEDKESTIYHDFTPDALEELYENLLSHSKSKWNTLILIDDYGAEFKRKPIELALKRICLKNRHLRATIMMLTQNYYMLPKGLREICNNVIMFNTNKSQNLKMFKEQLDINEEEFNELMGLLKTRHDYMIINLNYKRIFVDWNEIIFKKDI